MGRDRHPEPTITLSFSTDRPLHDVAAELRNVAAGGAGLRAAADFAYAAAAALDPAALLVAFVEQGGFDTVDELLDLVPPAIAYTQHVSHKHTGVLMRLATAAGQLLGGENALRAVDDNAAADAVAAAHLSAADVFFATMIAGVNPLSDGRGVAYADLLSAPVSAARRALTGSSKAHRRAMPAVASVLGSAAIALKRSA